MTLAQLDEQIARIEFAKQNMYMALLEKGVSLSPEDSIEMYADYIRSIGPGPVPVEDTPLLWIGNGELDMENPYEESDVSFDLGFQLGTLMNARIEMRISEPDREGYTRYYLSDVTDDMSDLRTKIYGDNVGLQANMNGNVNPDGYEPFQQPFTFSVYMSEDTDNPGMYKPTMEVESTGTFYGESTNEMSLGSMMHNAMVFKNTMGGSYTGIRGSQIYSIKIADKDNPEIVYHNFVPVLHEGVPCFKDEMSGQYFYTSGVEEPTYEEAQEDGPANNEIWYYSPEELQLNQDGLTWGDEELSVPVSMTAHTFENGKGIITFDGDVVGISDVDYGGSVFTNFDIYDPENHAPATRIVLPQSIKFIGGDAFYGYYNLESVEGTENVTSMSEGAFEDTGIFDLPAMNSLSEIPDSAFLLCNRLSNITIPSNIGTIGYQAFDDCTMLSTVTCESSVPAQTRGWESDPWNGFYECPNLTAIYVPAESVADYQAADGWSDYASLIQGI